jgi:hypothetical protein|tara:strand:- start:2895 stop:3107 length:213 start_codon:yes stop_codon:yes gene_type:complete
MKEFNLSDKIPKVMKTGDDHSFLFITDVKEFIKELKKPFNRSSCCLCCTEWCNEIDKLAGDKLVAGDKLI